MKTPIAILLLASFSHFPTAAASNVSRCATADGAATYTDGSCRALGGKPVPMSANLMRNLAREGVLAGDEAFQPAPGSTRAAAVRASIGSRHQLGGASCPRTPAELAAALRGSLGEGEVNRLAALYDWTGKTTRDAQAILRRLERMSERPLIDGHYFSAARSPDSGGTVQLVQGAQSAPTVTELAVVRRAGCLFLGH